MMLCLWGRCLCLLCIVEFSTASMHMHVFCPTFWPTSEPIISDNAPTRMPFTVQAYHLPLLQCHLVSDSGRARLFPGAPVDPASVNKTETFWRMSPPNPATSPCIDGLCLSAEQVRLEDTLHEGEINRQEKSIWAASVGFHALRNRYSAHHSA